MDKNTESRRAPKRRIDAAARTRFLEGLRAGLPRDEAARAAGFTANAFYYACKADPVFALARAMALELSAAVGRAARGARGESPPPCEVTITPTGGRLLQKRHIHRVRFDDRRKRLFLDRFAVDADAEAACEAAAIAYSTYTQHRRKDPEFDAACDEALIIAYAALEAEAVRERLAAQRKLRDGIRPAGAPPGDFDRTMKLLERHGRKCGGIGPRAVPHGSQQRWNFDDALALFGRKLRAYGFRRGIVPPDAGPPAENDEG